MAQYKVIQDIEADDKLLGPLTFRQFVYAGITAFCLWFCYVSIAKGVPFLLPIFVIPGVLAAFFAFPWSKEQPTELWALARIRFLFKPRKRIWDQTGLKELVTITVPKKIEHVYSDGLSQTEVRSRLTALANTIDTRGWAIKNAAGNPYAAPMLATTDQGTNDRLLEVSSVPHDVPAANETYEDMLDPSLNPKARQFDSMLQANAQQHRQQLMSSMQANQPAQTPTQQTSTAEQVAPDYWFLNQPTAADIPAGNQMFGQQAVTPGSMPAPQQVTGIDENAAIEELRKTQASTQNMSGHMPTLLPLAEQQRLAEERARQQAAEARQNRQIAQPQTVQSAPDAAILDLARNDDLNISTIARQAQKAQDNEEGEVVISLR
jgi:PrgI family protein